MIYRFEGTVNGHVSFNIYGIQHAALQHTRFVESFARLAQITEIATLLDQAQMCNNHLAISNLMSDVGGVFNFAENLLRQFSLYTDGYAGGEFFPRRHRRILGTEPILHLSFRDYRREDHRRELIVPGVQ